MESAEHIIDIGPGAGENGGKITFNGTYKKLLKSIGSHIMKLQFETENMSMKDRDQVIFKKLSEIEKKGIF